VLRDIGCVVSSMTAGTKTRRVHRAMGAGGGACNAPLPCCAFFSVSTCGGWLRADEMKRLSCTHYDDNGGHKDNVKDKLFGSVVARRE